MSTAKKVSRREFLRVAALGTAGLAIASCAPAPPTAAPEQPAAASTPQAAAPAAEPVTVEFWQCFGGTPQLVDAEKAALVKFKEANPNITVNYVEVPFEQSHEKLVTALASGAGPDFWHVTMVYNAEFGASGYLAELDPYLDPLRSDLIPASLEEAKYKDKTTTLPSQVDLYLQYYRSDILGEAGVEPPATLADMVEFGLKLTNPDKPLYAFPVKGARHTHFQILPITMAWNGPGVNHTIFDEADNCLLNTEVSIEAYQWWGDLLTKHKISPPTSPTDLIPETRQQFFAGTLATTWDWLGAINQFDENVGREKYSMVSLPPGPKGVFHPWGGNGYMMSGASQHKDETWQVMAHLLTPEANGSTCQGQGVLPANKKAFEQEWLQKPIYKPVTETMGSAELVQRVPTWLPEWAQFVTEVAIENNQKFLLGQQSAKESLDIQAAFLTEAQKKYLASA